MDPVGEFKRRVAAELGDGVSVALFWKGRVALYALLRAVGVGPGDEVILPAFTCVVVPSAILYLGATPVYAEVDERTYNVDVGRLAARITPRTRVILAQNTFGLSPDSDAILELSRDRRWGRPIRVIEDCAHGFGGRYRGRPNGVSAEAAFFSTQWSKPLSTGLGGIAVTRDPEIAERLAAVERAATPPTVRERLLLAALARARSHPLVEEHHWKAVKAYRFLGRHGFVMGSSDARELEAPVEPPGFLKGFSPLQATLGLAELERLPARIAHRRRIARLYDERLATLGFPVAAPPDDDGHGHLKYPLRVRRREALLAEAQRRELELGDWFLSPIHPIRSRLDRWRYRVGDNPVAERAAAEMVNLPTHERIDEAWIDRLFRTVDLRAYR